MAGVSAFVQLASSGASRPVISIWCRPLIPRWCRPPLRGWCCPTA